MRTLLNKPVHCRNSAMLTGLCLCLIHMYAQVNATNSNSYIERYKAILLQHPEFTPFSWGSNTIYIDTEYTLYDVDKNGIPELISRRIATAVFGVPCVGGEEPFAADFAFLRGMTDT